MSETTQRRRVEITEALKKKIVKSYVGGTSIVKTADALDVPPGMVRRVLAASEEVELRPRGRYPDAGPQKK